MSLHSRVQVPDGSHRNALQTREWSRLEPGVVDSKYDVRGIGEAFEGSLGAREVSKLVSIKRS